MPWVRWALRCFAAVSGACIAASTTHDRVLCMPPGWPRLLASAPALLLLSSVPCLFNPHTEPLSKASAAAICLWLASFKILLLVLGRGPLADPSLRKDQFMALLLWPVLHKADARGAPERVPPGTPHVVLHARARDTLLHRLTESVLICVLAATMLTHPAVPLFFKAYAAAFGVCAYCSLWANAARAWLLWAHGLETSPSWDRPWLQNSLSDFWSRRWNLPAAYSLRALVYQPIVEGRAVKLPDAGDTYATDTITQASPSPGSVRTARGTVAEWPAEQRLHALQAGVGTAREVAGAGSRATADVDALAGSKARRGPRASAVRRLAALAATFAVSGAMHELLLLVCTGWAAYRPVSGLLMLYFMLQVPLSLLEQATAAAMKHAAWQPHNALAVVVTSLTLQIPGLFLFWHPIWTAATTSMSSA